MTNYKYLRGASISDPSRVIFDIPDAPTIGTATDVGTSRAYNNGAATVSITSKAVTGGPTTGYTVTSTPDSFTGSGTSPITVTGLSSATSYTFTAKATNTSGSSPASTATSAITATTVPQAPTIGTFTDGGTGTTGTLSFTAGSTGGKSITGYKVSTDGTTYTTVSGTTSPLSLTGLTAGTYTFYLKATNANGDSSASSGVSGTVITPSSFESIATATPTTGQIVTFSSIPNTYKSLQIRITGLIASSENYGVRFNGDSGTNYTLHYLYGNGTSVLAAGFATPFDSKISINANSYISQASPNPLVSIIDIHDYTSTSKNKTLKAFSGADNNAGNGKVGLGSGVWLSTAAITSLSVVTDSYNFMSGTSIALYGIKG